MSDPKYIVVIGASAGGLNSVIEICAQLKQEMNMAVFIVVHITPTSSGDIFIQRIQRNTTYKCVAGEHGMPVEANHIYIAVPDKHMLVKNGKIISGDGPAENRWRPSIDALFRSAAASYDSRAIGIILSGMLQDGTAGMAAIKRSGGTCIVQDPEEAEYPDMPQSVLDNVDVDYCVRLDEMGAILLEKSLSRSHHNIIPEDIKLEAAIAEKSAVGIDKVAPLGNKSLYSCPDCGGGLWEITHDGFSRYRCHTGHVYTAKELLLKQNQSLENTLWVALRMMEERKNLLNKMGNEELSKGWIRSAAMKKEREMELDDHIERLKNILFEAKDLGAEAVSSSST